MEKYIEQLKQVLNIVDVSPIQNKTEVVGRYKKNGHAVSVNLYNGNEEANKRIVSIVLQRGA